jgi:phosphatidylinositol alpha-1,6-mannosyltransferase
VVLTLYGTEIWHYSPKIIDLFTRAYRRASAVTFYSQRLLDRARELGLDRPALHVIYPPVAASFRHHDEAARDRERAALGITARRLLVNVKRLHPLAGQRYLLEAMPAVLAAHPDTHLVICGTGALMDDLRSVARSAGVERHVTFAGLVDNALVARYCAAADLFVLPSLLEALPTVAVEALASGTPVVSSDNPGGVELNGVFGEDVQVVPREDAPALAAAITARLRVADRTLPATRTIVEERFRADAVAQQYWSLYSSVSGGARSPRG